MEANDLFGSPLAAGDVNGDLKADLEVGTPYEDGSLTDVGVVNTIKGSATGLTSTGARQLVQSNAAGAVEANDRFGYALP